MPDVIHSFSEGRGWAEIVECGGEFQVYDWDEHHDSGAIVSSHRTRREAVAAMLNHARQTGRKTETADVVAFPSREVSDA